jgi:hypothetical protein
VRKMKSAMVNMAHEAAGFDGKPAVRGSEGKKYIVTRDYVFHDWFERFMRGMHNRMGDNVQQDLGLTADIMVKLMERLELDWKVAEMAEMKDSGSHSLEFSAWQVTPEL